MATVALSDGNDGDRLPRRRSAIQLRVEIQKQQRLMFVLFRVERCSVAPRVFQLLHRAAALGQRVGNVRVKTS